MENLRFINPVKGDCEKKGKEKKKKAETETKIKRKQDEWEMGIQYK